MIDDYAIQTRDDAMRGILLSSSKNVQLLEEILSKESRKLNTLNFKPASEKRVSKKQAEKIFPEVCVEVNSFLNSGCDIPDYDIGVPEKVYAALIGSIGAATFSAANIVHMAASHSGSYGEFYLSLASVALNGLLAATLITKNSTLVTHYAPGAKGVRLAKDDLLLPRVAPYLGHEYCHHVQNRYGFQNFLLKNSIFKEGHARGVQKHISELYASKEDDTRYIHNYLSMVVPEFQQTYLWLCNELKVRPRLGLTLEGSKNKTPGSHALGSSLFAMYESLHGKQIYRDMVHRRFVFSELT